MADVGVDFDFLVASADRSIEQVRRHPRLQRRTEGRGSALAEHVDHTLDQLGAEVAWARQRFEGLNSAQRQRALLVQVRFYNHLVRGVHYATPWLDKASEPQLDLGVMHFIDEAANALVGADCDVVVVADAEYMYSTVSWPFRDTLTKHLRQPAPTGTRPVVMSYPSRERHTTLLHPLFAHELGHVACDAHGLVDEAYRDCKAQAWFPTAFAEALADYVAKRGIPSDQAQYRLEDLLRDWHKELLCDALALDYLGPTFLFCFSAFLLATGWNEPSESHPPATLRTHLLLTQLQARGWDELVRERAPRILEWLADAGATPLGALQPPYMKFIDDTCRAGADRLTQISSGRLGPRRWEPAHFSSVESSITELFEHRILPAATRDGEPFDRRVILLAAWLHLFRTLENVPRMLANGLHEPSVQESLARALEMSVILEKWREL